MGPHLGYGDVICDRACSVSFRRELESMRCSAALAVAGAAGRGACAGGLYSGLRWIVGYLGLALVFLWGGAQREEFNFCFSRFFC